MFCRINFYRMVAVTLFSLVTANAYSQLHIVHIDENGNATEQNGSGASYLNKINPKEVQKLSTGAEREEQPNATEPTAQSASKEKSAAYPNLENQKFDFAEGWLVKMFPAPEDLKTIPYAEMASFVVNKSPYTLIDHRKTRELDFFKEPTAYLYEGFFNAKEDGMYSFIANIVIPLVPQSYATTKCKYYLWVEDQKIIDLDDLKKGGIPEKEFSKSSSLQLQEGLYRVKQWLACDHYWPTEVNMRIKRPSSALPTLAKGSDFYHKVKE